MRINKLNAESGIHEDAAEFGGEEIKLETNRAVFTADEDAQDVDVLTAETTRRNGRDFQIEETRQNALLTKLAGADEFDAEDAFGELFNHYEDKLMSLVMLWTNDHHDSQDIVMETFTAVWQGREKVTANGRFWMFLKKMAMNAIRNRHRNNEKRRTQAMDMTDTDAVHAAAVEPTSMKAGPEQQALMNEKMGAVEDGLSRLKPNEQTAIRLQAEGVKGPEIARELGLKVNRVKSLVRNAKLKLAADLTARYPDLFKAEAE